MDAIRRLTGRSRIIAAAALVLAVLVCAIFMPEMAMAALAGCVAVIGLVTVVRRAPSPVRPSAPKLVDRVTRPTLVIGAGPPISVPLRT